MGPAAIVLSESATLFAAGQRLPGANISIKPQATVAVEAGYFLTSNVAVSFTGGLPPFAKIEGAGTMAGVGRVGATTYGPMTLTAHYHFTEIGRLQPYVGAGPAFMYVFDEKDGVMAELKVDNAVGFAFQVGADYMVTDRWGLFIDVKKAILRTEAKGFYGIAPIDADIKLDPLVVHGGISVRF
jgi:outer membrane protein